MVNNKASKASYWKHLVAVLTVGWVAIWIYRTALTPVYPILSEFFGGVSDSSLGVISSSYFLGYVIMQIPSGILVDRFGQKRVIIPGFLLFALGVFVVSLARDLFTMYAGSVLAGLGCGTFYGCAYSLTAEYVPEKDKSLATAIVNSGMAIGSGFGLITSSYLVGRRIITWPVFLLAIFVFALVVTVIIGGVVRTKPKAEALDKSTSKKRAKGTNIRALFTRRMITAYILYFSTMYAYYLIDTWLPNFLETERGFSGASIGIASSLVFFAAIPGALVFSRIADRHPHKKVPIIVVLELIAAAMLLFMITTNNPTFLIIGIIAYGFFGKLAVEPIIISWMSRFGSGGSLATMYGVFNFFGMMSSVIAPTVTGTISDFSGTKIYGFYVAIIIILIGTGIFYFVNKESETDGSVGQTIS